MLLRFSFRVTTAAVPAVRSTGAALRVSMMSRISVGNELCSEPCLVTMNDMSKHACWLNVSRLLSHVGAALLLMFLCRKVNQFVSLGNGCLPVQFSEPASRP